jgi:glycosyltransferase involved in cell wall biosynthesis
LRETADFVAEAKQALPDVHLLMLCPDVAGARSALERSRLPKDRATVISAAHAEVPRFLAAADAAFLMVAASPGKDVCSPMKFSEYLACGLPVVIGPVVGDYTRWVRDERVGVVADPARPEDWPRAISALVELLKDSVLPARCRQVACERLDTAKHPTLLRRAIAAAAKARA